MPKPGKLRLLRRKFMIPFTLVFAASTAFGQTEKQVTYPPITWRIQHKTTGKTITGYEVVFTAKDGKRQVIPSTSVSIGPGTDYDVVSWAGPCFVKIEGQIEYSEKERALTGSIKQTITEQNCIEGVRSLQLKE
jgi:hypothetical protein